MNPDSVRHLTITVVQAKLVKNYGFARMDPYVRLRVGHFVHTSGIAVNAGCFPRWNDILESQLPAGVETIAIEVYDQYSFASDALIAWADVRIPPSVLHGETYEAWHPLSGEQGVGAEGSINLVISFNPVVVQPRMVPTNAPVMLVPNVFGGTMMPVFVTPNQPQVAWPPPVLSYDDINRIHEMFPQIHREIIDSVVVAYNQDRDAVINALLQMSS